MRDEPNDGDPSLDRAIDQLRDVPPPDGPTPLLAQRTLAMLWEAELQAERNRGRWIVRIAAAIVMGVSAAAVTFSFLQRHPHNVASDHSGQTSPSPPPAMRKPPPPSVTVAHGDEPPHAIAPQATDFEPPQTSRPRPAAFASAVTLTGRVYYDGRPPVPRLIDLSACPQCLAALRGPIYDESMLVNDDGTLQNVVVSVSAGLPQGTRIPVPPDPLVLDQKYCTFEPHVVAAMVGQEMLLRNSDRLLHSSHSMDSDATPLFNFALPTVGQRRIEPFQAVETFKVKCDLHPWMSAWVRVLPNPYFDVTRSDGTFTIRDLPRGIYRLKAWHELLGVVEKDVTVHGGEPVVVDFTFPGR